MEVISAADLFGQWIPRIYDSIAEAKKERRIDPRFLVGVAEELKFPLHVLEQVCHYAVLLEAHSYPDRSPTPLSVAASYGSKELVNHLIRKGFDVNHEDHPLTNPLIWALNGDNIVAFKSLVLAGANVNYIRRENSVSILNIAIVHASSEMVQVVLDLGGQRDVNHKAYTGHPPLWLCMAEESPVKLKMVFRAGGDAFQTTTGNETLLDEAFANPEMMALLRNGAVGQQLLALCSVDRFKKDIPPISRLPRELLRALASFLLTWFFLVCWGKKVDLGSCDCGPIVECRKEVYIIITNKISFATNSILLKLVVIGII
jgi:hypothetical protein